MLLLSKSWKMNILSWPILCTSSSWLQACSAPFPPSEATRLWLHLWYVKHTCTLHAKIFFCSCHYFVGLCKFLPFQAQPSPFVFENAFSALCCNQTEGNCFIQVTLWRFENAVYSHERHNFNLDLYENGQLMSLWYPEADEASHISSGPWRISLS